MSSTLTLAVEAAGAAEDGGFSTQQIIGVVVAVLVAVGWALYLLANVRRSKSEVGSEIELAQNRKPYLNDDQLEGPKLERALSWGLISLAIVGVGLPLYWLAEPGRQSGAVSDFDETFASRGAGLFAATSEGGFNCAGCHGGNAGIGGEIDYTLTEVVTGLDGEPVIDPETDAPRTQLRQVSWQAPALNTVTLRMTDEQITDVLVYGRPFSPMPAWGIEGGGPMNEQQIGNLVEYLHSIAISPEEAVQQAEDVAAEELRRLYLLDQQLALAENAEEPDPAIEAIEAEIALDQQASRGAALFNTQCARCHTAGWSYDEPQQPGGGATGPALSNVLTQFPDPQDHYDWVAEGAEFGERYGQYGQSEGRMPYFGGQLSPEQIDAIVAYERQELATSATVEDADGVDLPQGGAPRDAPSGQGG